MDSSHIYWANNPYQIKGAELSSCPPCTQTTLFNGIGFPTGSNTGGLQGVAVDSTHLYWTSSQLTNQGVWAAGLDGSNPTRILPSNGTTVAGPLGITVGNGHIYWANNGDNTISEAGLDGSDPTTLISLVNLPGVGNVQWVAVTSTHIYWTRSFGTGIEEANLDGSDPHQIVSS